ncbi:polysaccharide deacetylase family protein [Clostridium bowmanii]|uniref:polysaccharide deacetylase family protein n=1 Tax=Clostridium bowmanii TaxID=132925 RepID=UPI001C0BA112|nr:polysaccharide deacetylase family protein [Clostridium bowmanii]MBU3189586.1 polysaccharide deacetylase family protein [Clostridium bowmanii]MCA1073571.1 polysaccharide deacetylase family protein [Clostridium bowmanii]
MKKKVALLVTILTVLSCQVALAASGITKVSSLNVKISSESNKAHLAAAIQKVPVLMYHKIAAVSSKTDGLIIGQSVFYSQMNYLKANGYTTITMDQFYANISKRTVLPKKPVLITFDDGYESNYTLAYPVLKANNQKATVFMIGKNIDKDRKSLTSKQIKEMDANGFRVENHTFNHEQLGKLSYASQLATITKAKQALEKILGRKVTYIAYPCGSYTYNTIQAAHAAGCTLGLSTDVGLSSKADNPYTINRVFIGPLDTLITLQHKLNYGI